MSAGTFKGAISGESSEVFVSQMARALRKADETEYWLQLLHFGGFISEAEWSSVES